MSSVQRFRDFINERLTAAAVEIFSLFEQTIVEYEREIEHHRRTLDNSCKHDKLTTASGLLQYHDYKEEDEGENLLHEQQLHHHDVGSCGTGQEAESCQVKEEQQDVSTCPDGERLALKQENDAFMVTLTYDASNSSEPDSEQLHPRLHPANERHWEQSGHENSRSMSDAEPQSVAHTSENHCDTDAGLKSVMCDFCGRGFKKQSAMKRHQKIHTGERPHSCKTCGKGFRDGSVLLRHMRTHTGEKPFACKTCGKRFKDNSVLLRHTRIHTGEKPYACKICGKRFKDSSAVLRHMKIHSDERLHACNTCGKRFICKTRLSSHMKIHTNEKPYACKICGKSFKFNFKLSYHERTHTDKASCLCNTCGKTFTDPSTLKRHTRIHTDEKPFACTTCGKSFRDNYKLLYHIKVHTNVNSPS